MDKYKLTSRRVLRAAALIAIGAAASALTQAQSTNAAAPTAQQLAKYDANKNGRLDPAELSAMQADEAKLAKAVNSTTANGSTPTEDVVQLSPFEVSGGNDKGYAASNTLSGTRLNSSIEDIAGSISVVTKQQLIDTAALDINDIFLYEVGTEGTGQFTDMTSDGRNEGIWDNVSGNPTGANRIRGLAAANIAVGGFTASGTIPIDTYNVDAVEISRGSNSTLAGLGEAGGTVNLITSRANVSRESSQIVTRFDNYGGFRTSLDLNRPLIRNKLSVRFSAVYNETGYIRKPSIDRTDRQQIAFTARPFKNTTLTGSYEIFTEYAVRANSITPRDSISLWKSRGSPTWDPYNRIGTSNGVALPVGTNPTGLATGFGATRMLEYIDDGKVALLIKPANVNNTILGLTTGQSMSSISNEAAAGPLFKVSGTTNKAVYDWTEINMAASAYQAQSAKILNANLDQSFFNTQRNRLDLNIAWRREDQRDYRRQFIGQLDGVGTTLQIDPNERLPDGRANPFFLRPFIGGVNPQVFRKPVFNDSYRAQLAYQLDLRREPNLFKWLGMHRAIGYGEYKVSTSAPQNLRYHDLVVENPNFNPLLAALTPTSNLNSRNDALMYTLYYMGPKNGTLQYANTGAVRYNGNFTAPFAGATSTSYRLDEPLRIEETYFALDTQKKKVRTFGGSIQSYFLNDQIVTTFGQRKDRAANSANLPLNLVNGLFDETNLWNFGRNKRWQFGKTSTSGVVVKPFRSFSFLKHEAEQGTGVTRVLAQAVQGLNFYYNKSKSFAPQDTAYDLFLRELPNPSGDTKEYGVGISMFDNRFSVRVAHQETTQQNSRAATGVIATRALGIDFHPGGQTLGFNLNDAAIGWEQALHPAFTSQQVQDAAAKRIGYTPGYVDGANNKVIADASDAISKGWELELQLNPTRYWTLRATGNQQTAIDAHISSTIQEFIATRLPIWTTITVPTDRLPDGSQLLNAGALWWNLNQSGGLPSTYYNTNVRNALLPLIAGQGKQKPQTGKYSFSFVTNFQLGGLGSFAEAHPWLKNATVGGSYRWASKRAIGYLGAAPDSDGVVRTLDKDKPVYGPTQSNLDFTMSYRTRLFRNKIGTRFQLNIRNLPESGHLEGVAVNPDGRPYQYRIIDPRQFIFTTTFDL